MKTVLITGASRGIGRSIALEFAKKNYNIVITCFRSAKELYEVEREIVKMGAKCHTFVGDIGNSNCVETLMNEISLEFGGVDILINNAGIAYMGLLSDMTDDEWNNILNTNLSSVFYCSRGVVPHMVSKKAGKIINISSVWGNVGASCEVAYSATKAGVHGFTKALAKELAPSNVQVNALALGAIDTSMNACFTKEEKMQMCDEIPAGRFGTPTEIGEVVINLAEGTEYMTGQIITVDGGWN